MVDLSRPTEELIYNIEADHEELQFLHETFAETLGGIIEQAQEVYVRDEIAKGLAEVATPGWYYFGKFCCRDGDRAELDEIEFWFGEDGQLRDALEDYYKEDEEEEFFYKLIGDEI